MKFFLLHKFNNPRRLFLLLPLFLVSCFQENEYKMVLEEYVDEDIRHNKNRKEYEVSSLESLAEERPEEFELMYEEAKNINVLVSEFESFILKSETVDAINVKLKFFKENISTLNLKEFSMLNEELDLQPLTRLSEKYKLLRKLKNINFERYNLLSSIGCDLSGISSYRAKMLASRLNDSVVVLNIFSRLLKQYNTNFDDLSINVSIKNNKTNAFVGVNVKPSISYMAYLVKSRSDTLFIDAILKTNERAKLLVAKNSSYIYVGELKEFDENYVEDYFKEIYN
ncbi:hypothetical protein [uncultured Psychroserpens sp.]|uniref:hypothetical protein n=1 Tax=uncultured Psychroserpens sp. TaxID=255436 RepID=UPI002621DC44|nr:hypothetical protein [uncultured Psychroserpens sp.]